MKLLSIFLLILSSQAFSSGATFQKEEESVKSYLYQKYDHINQNDKELLVRYIELSFERLATTDKKEVSRQVSFKLSNVINCLYSHSKNIDVLKQNRIIRLDLESKILFIVLAFKTLHYKFSKKIIN